MPVARYCVLGIGHKHELGSSRFEPPRAAVSLASKSLDALQIELGSAPRRPTFTPACRSRAVAFALSTSSIPKAPASLMTEMIMKTSTP